jgi:thiol-disulfide isomerase/thioredoxin
MKAYAIGLVLALMFCSGTAAAETLCVFEPDSMQKIKTERAGKPTVSVIMVWALDCAYCIESFRALEQIRRHWKADVITIATDRADDAEAVAAVRKKLQAGGLRSQAWAFGSAPEEQLRYGIDPKWRGELPRSYWFNGQGKVVAHSGVITVELAEQQFGKRETSKR